MTWWAQCTEALWGTSRVPCADISILLLCLPCTLCVALHSILMLFPPWITMWTRTGSGLSHYPLMGHIQDVDNCKPNKRPKSCSRNWEVSKMIMKAHISEGHVSLSIYDTIYNKEEFNSFNIYRNGLISWNRSSLLTYIMFYPPGVGRLVWPLANLLGHPGSNPGVCAGGVSPPTTHPIYLVCFKSIN